MNDLAIDAYSSLPVASSRIVDLLDTPQAVVVLLAGCLRVYDIPALAILVLSFCH
jgi:hypothetical protein